MIKINPAVHIALSFCKLFIAVRTDGSEETNIVCCFKACWPVCLCTHTCTLGHTHLPKSRMFSDDCDNKRSDSPAKSPSVRKPCHVGFVDFFLGKKENF